MPDIELVKSSPVATVTLNRPDDLNRLTPDSMALLGRTVEDIASDDEIHAALSDAGATDFVCAPEFEDGSLEIISKRSNLRVVRIDRIDRLAEFENHRFIDFKSLIDGGIIVQQSAVNSIRSVSDLKPATATWKDKEYRCEREPDQREIDDMIFGWAVEHGVTSP